MSSRILARVALLLAVLFTLPNLASAQPLADRVPADSILYVGWRGMDDPGPGYQGSRFQAIVEASKFREVFREMLPRVIRRVEREDLQAGRMLKLLTDITGPMLRYPTALYFHRVDFSNPNQPLPKLGIICRAGTNANAIADRVRELLAQADMPPDAPIRVEVVAETDVCLLIGYLPDEAAVVGQQGHFPSLGESEAFKSVLGKVGGPDATVTIYFEFEVIWRLADDVIAMANDPAATHVWNSVRESSGLMGLRRAVQTFHFDQRDWVSTTFIDAPAPRKGIVSLLDRQPLDEATLKLVPQDATFFATGQFDPVKLITEVRNIAGSIDPLFAQRIDQGLGAATLAIGRKLMTDILEPLGAQWVAYSSPSVAGNGILGYVIINKLDDAAKAQQGVTMLSLFLTNSAATGISMARLPIQLDGRRDVVDEFQLNYLAMPIVSPTWSIHNGHLYLALYPQVALSGARASKSAKSILENNEFQRMRARLNATNANGIAFFDLPKTAPDAYQTLLFASSLISVGDLFGIRSPMMVLPTFDVFQAQLTPMASAVWVDDSGYTLKSISPFPFAELFSIQGGGLAGIGQILGVLGAASPQAAMPR